MSWTRFRRFYGLSAPYDFRVAMPFLLNTLGLSLVLITGIVMLSNGTLTFGTERFIFFAYLSIALCLAAALSRATMFCMALFLWCCIEALLASAQFFPRNVFTEPSNDYLVYHPLLQLIPKKNYRGGYRFDESDRARYVGVPINWKRLPGEVGFSINSLGLRGPELTARDRLLDFIFIYGGSTTYDIAVSDDETWVERLQSIFDPNYRLLNFGVTAHSTAQHLIYTAFYQDVGGKRPVCAVYYVGWNDTHNAHFDGLDRGYADHHMLELGRFAAERELWGAKYSPAVGLIDRLLSRRFDSIPEPPAHSNEPAVEISDPRLESIFVNNVSTIAAINRARGIRTVFIGQMLNRSFHLIEPETPNAYLPRVKNKNVWPTQERFNRLLKETAVANGATYVDPGIEHFEVDDFVDYGHFTAAGSRKFAGLIAKDVEVGCGLSVAR